MSTHLLAMHRAKLILALLVSAVFVLAFMPSTQAATPIYVRPAGDDTLCNGTVDVDYSGGAAPNCAVQTIGQGVTLVDPGGAVYVRAGTYVLPALVTINKTGVTLDGDGAGATIVQVSGTGDRIDIAASGVTLQDFEIEKTDTTGPQDIIRISNGNNVTIKNNTIHGQYVYPAGDVSRALVINAGAFSGLTIENNVLHSLRQPAYVSGTHTGTVQNNYVYATKGWVLEGGNLTFTGNTWGTGAQANVYDIAILGTMPPAYYTDIVAMSNANSGAVIEDQRPALDVLSVVKVDAAAPVCTVDCGGLNPYHLITPAIPRVVAGGTIKVADGTYSESFTIDKSLTLRSANGRDVTTIDLQSGPTYLGAIHVTGAVVTIDGFTINGFDAVGAGVASTNVSVAYPANNVTLKNNRFKIGQIGPGTTGDDGFGIVTYYDTANFIASLTVTDNDFLPLNAEGRRAFYINPGVDQFTFTDNVITGKFTARAGMQAKNSLVEENVITGVGAAGSRSAGMFTWGDPDPSIYGKATFRDNSFTGVATAITIFSANDVVVEDNTFSQVGVGVSVVEYYGVFDPTTIDIHQNKFLSADTYAVANSTIPLVDATPNYFGTADCAAVSALISGNVSFIPYYADGTLTVLAAVPVTNVTQSTYFCAIQPAIDAANSGDVIQVAAGTFNETVTVNKRVTIDGAGSGASDTVISSSAGGQGGVVQLAASGLSASQPVLLKDLRIQPTGMAGISVGLFSQATGTSVSFVELDNVHVVGTNTNPCTEQERGLYVDLTSSLTNLKISNSAFDNLHYGWYLQKQVSADASAVQYVDVQNTTFNHNNLKGIYAEKLEDATFTGVTVSQNGYDGSLLGACSYFNPWLAGVDVNLKAGTYQNLTFAGATITSNALGNAKEGVGLTAKARDDGATYGAFPATLNNVLVNGGAVTGNERGLRFGEPGKNNAGPTSVVVQNVCISGNVKTYGGVDGSAYGGLVNQSLATDTAVNNWWGSATGPTNPGNPTGTGDAVVGLVTFTPWLNACGGSPTGNFYNQTDNTYFATMQAAVNAASYGDVIVPLAAGPFGAEGSATVSTNGITINLSGRTFGPGSPAFTITANDVTILGPGVIDGGGSTFPGILVQSGAGNFTLRGVEVKGWADGVQVGGPVVSLKITNNWIHDNSDAGLQVDATPSGVITINGNLFKANGGSGVVYGGSGSLNATYNSWGDLGGPTGTNGDGVGAGVSYIPWTFSELYMDVDPPANALTRSVPETTSFDVALKVDAAKLYGLTFQITYNPTMLTLNTTTFSAPWAGGPCVPLSAPAGTIKYRCNLSLPAAEYDATGGTIVTFNFTANTMPPGNGPWPTYFDISADPANTSTGAVGGIKVWVNNAGYGAPSVPARDITDTNDGEIVIVGLANFTGFVDLQGNDNDSGATLLVKNQQAKAGSVDLASGTSAPSGAYTTAHLPTKTVLVGSTYWLQFDAPLHLPTTIMAGSVTYPTVPTDWTNSALAATRPLTPLAFAFLLGGDATNNNVVEINDATCIGLYYQQPFTDCGGQPGTSPDVKANGAVDIFDLVLMGSNYELTYSPWVQP